MDVSLQPGASHAGHPGLDLARNLRDGDKIVGRVQEDLGEGRYRIAVGTGVITAASVNPLNQSEFVQLRVKSTGAGIELELIASGPSAPAPGELSTGGLVESLARLRAFLVATLSVSMKPLVDEFIAGLPSNFPVNERSSFVARELLAADVVASADTIRDTAARVFHDIPAIVIDSVDGSSSVESGARDLVGQLARVLGSLGDSPEALAELSRESVEGATRDVLATRPELVAFDKLVQLIDAARGLSSDADGGAILRDVAAKFGDILRESPFFANAGGRSITAELEPAIQSGSPEVLAKLLVRAETMLGGIIAGQADLAVPETTRLQVLSHAFLEFARQAGLAPDALPALESALQSGATGRLPALLGESQLESLRQLGALLDLAASPDDADARDSFCQSSGPGICSRDSDASPPRA
jgi:hypothetical protein